LTGNVTAPVFGENLDAVDLELAAADREELDTAAAMRRACCR
jgi:hypothetical protein